MQKSNKYSEAQGKFLPYPFYRIALDREIFTKRFFWDVNISSLDKSKDAFFVIERILQFGDLEHINWLFSNYDNQLIQEVIKNSRALSPKIVNYWRIVLNIRGKIKCLQKQFLNQRKKIWPY